MIKVTVAMANMITKIRTTITITEKNNSNNNHNNIATQMTFKI